MNDMKLIQTNFIETLSSADTSIDPAILSSIFNNQLDVDALEKFIADVFLNYSTVFQKSSALARSLWKIKENATDSIVEKIGHAVASFFGNPDLVAANVEYASGHVRAKNILAVERKKCSPIIKWIEVSAVLCVKSERN